VLRTIQRASLDRWEAATLLLILVNGVVCWRTERLVGFLNVLTIMAAMWVMMRRVLHEAVAYGMRKERRRQPTAGEATVHPLSPRQRRRAPAQL
jgi:hypothetical protein